MAPLNCTFFSIPKAFSGHFGIIQRNAIRSWTLLQPRPEIILFGDDPGTAEIARELQLRHEPQVERNEFGTPLVSGIFEKAQRLASNDLLCYVNADIILTGDFTAALANVLALLSNRKFLMVGRKTCLEINDPLDFERPDWAERLRVRAESEGAYVTPDSDYFAFPRLLYPSVPPFAIGRCYWSSWLMYNARVQGATMIDATSEVLAIESRHDYSHAVSTKGAKRLSGVEYKQNHRLFRGCRYFTTVDATHELRGTKLVPATFRHQLRSWKERAGFFVYFLVKGDLYPYTLPLIVLYRAVKFATRALRESFRPAVRGMRAVDASEIPKQGRDGF